MNNYFDPFKRQSDYSMISRERLAIKKNEQERILTLSIPFLSPLPKKEKKEKRKEKEQKHLPKICDILIVIFLSEFGHLC